ncbi:hypothetical protein [Clostridium senegalense]|uniref:Uncharacterized protein n=1 Tax=Clostridium senegalense TaxID=1465809 RepID=A0A6M0H2T0_9CLOT|nr:hypothetical protein [Clostridium senegalense]NEU05036.1 hypothetical protein [Clostridium senegalense]
MIKKKKIMIGCILACLFCIVGGYSYVNINQKKNFSINEIGWSAQTIMWTDKTKNNIYDIKFQAFDGTELKEIISLKDSYTMKIDSNVEHGDLSIKIYNNSEVFFEENGTVDETISIPNNNEKLKVEINGDDAKGHIKIKLT